MKLRLLAKLFLKIFISVTAGCLAIGSIVVAGWVMEGVFKTAKNLAVYAKAKLLGGIHVQDNA